jgi:2'-5' RNA ligase
VSDRSVRAFVALRPSEAQRTAIADGVRRLRGDHPEWARQLRFVRPDQVHLTLAFLAALPVGNVETLLDAARRAAAALAPFVWRLRGLGGFPRPDRARVVWLDVDVGREDVLALGAALRAELIDAGLPVEDRPFHPHLTLGRVRRGTIALPSEGAPDALNIDGGEARTDVVEVVRSDLGESGARHTILARWPLGG